jgi:tetratricopeptide (TPR) repeat protein
MTHSPYVTALVALGLALAPQPAAAQRPADRAEPPHHHGDHEHRLGTVEFPNSGATAAQEPFLRGVALLHSFEYEDAADAFRQAQAADPDFALAYWAEALTYARLLWGREDRAAAGRALERLGPTREARLARAQTPRERAWGAAVEALNGAGEQSVRSRAWADAMQALAQQDAADLEAAAFASIALLMAEASGGYGGGDLRAARRGAIDLAQRVFRANPDHPGAAHYLIHAYDDPEIAAEGLDVARAYASIAPDAQHALHMPSHIFVQVGLWDEAVASNERAWAASREWVRRRADASASWLDFHSLEWLQHGYLQQGRYRDARAVIDTALNVLRDVDVSGTVDPLFVVQRLTFRYAAETGDRSLPPVQVAAGSAPPGARDRYDYFSFISHYQSAVDAALRGDAASPAIAGFRALVQQRAGGAPERGGSAVALLQVDGLLAEAAGDRGSAIELFTRAAALEAGIPPVGPPGLLPSVERLAGMLLDAGRAQEAADAYERALHRWPNRAHSLLGLARARRALGDHAAAAATYQRLLASWHAAEADAPGLAEAREGAAAHTQ